MKLLEVNNRETLELFHAIPAKLYRDDPNWMPHLYQEIEHIFDPKRNGGFQNGAAVRWVLLDQNFEPMGRIAAFYQQKTTNTAVGGLGFYECIDRADYASCLFDQAEAWLKATGISIVEGPVNFGERHQFWGCQTGASMAIYQENYNPEYYHKHFRNQGFQPYYESNTYEVKIADIPFDWLSRLYHKIAEKQYHFVHFSLTAPEKFVEDYLRISAQAFELANRTIKIDKDTILHQLNVQKGVLREEFISFAYHHQQPVGVMGYMLNWSDMLNKALSFGKSDGKKSLKGFLVAILPEYQQKGVLVGLLYHIGQALLADPSIDTLYICGVAAYSHNVHSVAQKFHAKTIVKHITYRKTL